MVRSLIEIVLNKGKSNYPYSGHHGLFMILNLNFMAVMTHFVFILSLCGPLFHVL